MRRLRLKFNFAGNRSLPFEMTSHQCKYPSFSSRHFLRFPVSWSLPNIDARINQRSGPVCRLRINSAGVWLFNEECGPSWLCSFRQRSSFSCAFSIDRNEWIFRHSLDCHWTIRTMGYLQACRREVLSNFIFACSSLLKWFANKYVHKWWYLLF